MPISRRITSTTSSPNILVLLIILNNRPARNFIGCATFLAGTALIQNESKPIETSRAALVHQFNGVYGVDVDKIESWRELFRALEITPLPDNVKEAQKVRYHPADLLDVKCLQDNGHADGKSFERQVIRRLFVNLVDLTDARKTGEPVTKFARLADLQNYTIETGRYFPKQSAHAGGVLKFLLREILG